MGTGSLRSHPAVAASTPCIRIDKGILIPPARQGRLPGSKNFLPWRRMKVGDSFVYPLNGSLVAHPGRAAHEASRRMKAAFTTRNVVENGERVIRVWRIS